MAEVYPERGCPGFIAFTEVQNCPAKISKNKLSSSTVLLRSWPRVHQSEFMLAVLWMSSGDPDNPG
jgi:hypothetical protein